MCFFTRQNWPANKDNSVVYVTVSTDKSQRYFNFYQRFSNLSVVTSAYFVEIEDTDNWTTTEITVKNQNQERVTVQIPQPVFSVKKLVNETFEPSSIQTIIAEFPAVTGNRICACKK